jgi:hypothetical protein
MSEPTIDQVAPGGIVNLSNAPAAIDDATFDSLFPAESTTQVTTPVQQTQAQGTTQSQQTQTTQTATQTAATEPFIKGDKSVYKTPEAAIEGINQKDALIEQLRTRYALTTGIDPITGQPVGNSQAQVASDSYVDNPEKYINDLYAAAKSGGPKAYNEVQQKYIMDSLRPFAPALSSLAKAQALETVGKENPEAAKFINTPTYLKTLEANPDLQGAIASAESNHQFHSRLPGLYKLAHLAGQGMQLPELLKANASQTQTQTTPVRTTAQQTTLRPATDQGVKASFNTHQGIKQIIAEAEARGARLEF